MAAQMLNRSSADLEMSAALQVRIEKLHADIARLIGAGKVAKPAAKKGRGAMSAAQRAKLAGWICPLTPLENWLREAGGTAGYGHLREAHIDAMVSRLNV